MTVPPSALLLDVMGTVVYDPFYVEIPRHFGMSLEELIAAKHPEAWQQFELGHVDEAALLRGFFADGRGFDGQALKAAMRDAYRYLEGMESLLAELSRRGVSIHALSNYPCWYEMIEEELELSRYLDWSFVSCDHGVRKPHPEAYRGPARHLGLDPGTLLFVDDRELNCEAARAVGMQSLRFVDAPTLRRDLEAIGLI